MRQVTLYTGGGVSMSPKYEEGRRASDYVRLFAEEGMGITDGNIVTDCVDTKFPQLWYDCEAPDEDMQEEE